MHAGGITRIHDGPSGDVRPDWSDNEYISSRASASFLTTTLIMSVQISISYIQMCYRLKYTLTAQTFYGF